MRYSGRALQIADCSFNNFHPLCEQASYVVLNNVKVANTSAGARALTCSEGSRARITNVRGTTNAGTSGVASLSASRVSVTDPNTGTTVSDGGGNQATVGVLAVKTWAQINADAYADINDNSGAPAGGTGATISK